MIAGEAVPHGVRAHAVRGMPTTPSGRRSVSAGESTGGNRVEPWPPGRRRRIVGSMEALAGVALLLAVFSLLAVLALRYAVDSRPGFDGRPVRDDRPNWW